MSASRKEELVRSWDKDTFLTRNKSRLEVEKRSRKTQEDRILNL
jgi:hypothetical protein